MMLDINGEKFDTNNLFQFSLLGTVLEKLCDNNKFLTDKLDRLEKVLNIKDKKITELDNKITVIKNNTDKKIKNIEIILSKMQQPKGNQAPIITTNDKENQMTIQKSDQDLQENNTSTINNKESSKEISTQNNIQNTPSPILNITKEKNNDELDQDQNKTKNLINENTEPENNGLIDQDYANENNQINLDELAQIPLGKNKGQSMLLIAGDKEKSSELMLLLMKKQQKNEKILDELKAQIKSIKTKFERKHDDIDDNLNLTNKNLSDLKEDYEEFKNEQAKNEKLMEDIQIKLQEFSIYDVIKDNGNGTIDASKALVLALEKKVFKKFQFNDDKIKKLDDIVTKINNENKNITNLNELNNKKENKSIELFNNLEKEVDELRLKVASDVNEIDTKYNLLIEEVQNQLKDQINQVKNDIVNADLNINKVSQNISQNLDEIKALSPIINPSDQQNMDENYEKIVQSLNRKINELDRSLKYQLKNLNIDQLKDDVNKISNDLKDKVDKNEANEIFDKLRNVSSVNKELSYQMEGIEDRENKIRDEMKMITTKIESLTGIIANSSSGNDSSKNYMPIVDFSKFIDQTKFNEANKYNRGQIDKMKNELECLRRNIDDLFEQIKHIPNEKRFKDFQDTIKQLFDDNNLLNSKKFADKIDTNKNFKIIDMQIKNYIENQGKNDGKESWLIAKKPMSGYVCASCESNLKDLEQKYDYLPWNKYPLREEKSYRKGHGFSKMLQMVNMDILKTAEEKEKEKEKSDKDKGYSSDEENRKRYFSGKNYMDKMEKLPHVGVRNSSVIKAMALNDNVQSESLFTEGNAPGNSGSNSNVNINILDGNGVGEGYNNYGSMVARNIKFAIGEGNGPRLMKIYKKNKAGGNSICGGNGNSVNSSNCIYGKKGESEHALTLEFNNSENNK